MISRALEVTAYTAEVHFGELREDSSSLCDNTLELDEGVQVHLTEVTKFIFNGEVADTDKDLVVDVAVVRVDFEHGIISDFVQNREHNCGFFGQPNSECWLSAR
jgi:hypothetical protein